MISVPRSPSCAPHGDGLHQHPGAHHQIDRLHAAQSASATTTFGDPVRPPPTPSRRRSPRIVVPGPRPTPARAGSNASTSSLSTVRRVATPASERGGDREIDRCPVQNRHRRCDRPFCATRIIRSDVGLSHHRRQCFGGLCLSVTEPTASIPASSLDSRGLRRGKRSSCAREAGTSPCSIGFCVATTKNGRGTCCGATLDRDLLLLHHLQHRRLRIR